MNERGVAASNHAAAAAAMARCPHSRGVAAGQSQHTPKYIVRQLRQLHFAEWAEGREAKGRCRESMAAPSVLAAQHAELCTAAAACVAAVAGGLRAFSRQTWAAEVCSELDR